MPVAIQTYRYTYYNIWAGTTGVTNKNEKKNGQRYDVYFIVLTLYHNTHE